MKTVFVYRNHENLGIAYLSSALKKEGHKTDLVMHFGGDPFFGMEAGKNNTDLLVNRILETQPDLVAFSTVTDDYLFVSDTAKGIKKKSDVPIIIGGVHAIAVPERILRKDFVDIVCTGEGEEALVELANGFEDFLKGKKLSVPGLWFKRKGKVFKNDHRKLIEDLDPLPFPDKGLFYEAAPFFQDEYLAITSRGCPYRCTYCFNWPNSSAYENQKKFRRRSVNNVIEELVEAKKKWNIKRIFFFDDTFTANKKWVISFLRQYRKDIDLEFSCVTNINFIDNELARELKDAGCIKICAGVQTWNEELRKNVLHRNDNNEKIFNSIAALKKTGMYVQLDHLLGIHGEKMEDHIGALKAYNKARPNHISVYWMKYYPGIEIIDMLRERKLLSEDDIQRIEEGTYTNNSYLHGGSIKNFEDLYGINLLLNYLPVFPAFIVSLFIRVKLYDYFKFRSYFISNMVPKIIKTLIFPKDTAGRYFFKKTFFLLKNRVLR